MNNRLEELMYQAGLTAQGCWDEMDGYDHEAIEKFAELIVQECINATGNCAGTGDMIKEHFGVDPPPLLVRQVTIEEAIMATDN
jgi:hypothetical protein